MQNLFGVLGWFYFFIDFGNFPLWANQIRYPTKRAN